MTSSNQTIAPPPEWYLISPICDGIYLSGITPLSDPSIDQFLVDHQIGLILSALSQNELVIRSHEEVTSRYPEIGCLMVCYQDSASQNLWQASQGGNAVLTARLGCFGSAAKIREMVRDTDGDISSIDLAYRAIRMAQEDEKGVIVHCAAGVSRSASIVIYYLMKRYGYSYQAALSYLKSKRSIVSPNLSFATQLMSYQAWKDRMPSSR